MSSRPHFVPYPVIDAESMATSLTSDVTVIQKLSCPSYSYSWAGTSPVGAVSVEISNDYSQNADGSVKNAGTWTAIYFQLNGAGALVNSAPVTGNTGTGFIDVPITGAYAIRTVFTRTSGTGTLTATICCKVT
jgi:hypothetical protein